MNFSDKGLELIKIALTFLAWISVVIGWVVTDYLTKRRDVESQKRKIRTDYLVNVFRFLATSISNRNPSEEDWRKFEDIIADIQLFGTPEQIRLLKAVTNQIAEKKEFDLDPILNNLRDHLRSDLDLESIDGNIRWIRYQ
jgi:hypothetical protein